MNSLIPFRQEIISPSVPLMVWPHGSYTIPFNVSLQTWTDIFTGNTKAIYIYLIGAKRRKISIIINDVPLVLFNQEPLNISPHCIPSTNNMTISNELNDSLLEVSIQIELKISLDIPTLIHRIPHDLNLDLMSLSFTGFDNDELQIISNIRSDICPISFLPIKVGVKGKECKHSQEMDAESYLVMAKSMNSWKCPLCSLYLPPEDLIKP